MSEMTTCVSCRRERPDSDRFCRYCGIEVNQTEPEPIPSQIRTASVIGAIALLVLTGLWLQFRPSPTRPSEVGGPRQRPTTVEVGPGVAPDQQAAFASTEALLTEATGSLVVIGPDMTEAVVLHPERPRQRIALPPATRWEITDDALVGFADAEIKIITFAAPDAVRKTAAQNVYTDLNGTLIHFWRDANRVRVAPVLDDEITAEGDFSARAPVMRTRLRGGAFTIGPLLTSFDGDTYGWNADGEWEQVAPGLPKVASDPLVTDSCPRDGADAGSCEFHVVNLRSGQSSSQTWLRGTSTFQFVTAESAVPSPDLAWVLNAASRTLIDIANDSTLALSAPSRSDANIALWSLDSSIVGVAGDGLRLFTTRGEILADVIRPDNSTTPWADGPTATARFVRTDAFGAGR